MSAVARKGQGQPLVRQENEAMEEKGTKEWTEAAPVPQNTYTCFPRLFSPSLLQTVDTGSHCWATFGTETIPLAK